MNLSQFVYGLLGASFLWPWNALITASSLAKYKLVDHPRLYMSYSSIVMSASTLTSLISTVYLAYHSQNYGQRVKYGEVIIAVAFMLLAIAGGLESGIPWMLLLVSVTVVSSLGTALVQNGTLAITQHIPGPEHALAAMNGQAVAGVLPPVLQLAVNGTESKQRVAFLTFMSVSALSILACVLFLSKSNTGYVSLAEEASENEDQAPPSFKKLWDLTRQIKGSSIGIVLGFMVSLSYPVFANNVRSRSVDLAYFAPMTHLLWNIGDLLGRLMCSFATLRLARGRSITVYAVARIGFVVAFILVAKTNNPSDIFYLLSMLAFGITNGHLISSSIAHAPTCVPERLQPATGGLLGLIIATGLMLGSIFSFVTVALI